MVIKLVAEVVLYIFSPLLSALCSHQGCSSHTLALVMPHTNDSSDLAVLAACLLASSCKINREPNPLCRLHLSWIALSLSIPSMPSIPPIPHAAHGGPFKLVAQQSATCKAANDATTLPYVS